MHHLHWLNLQQNMIEDSTKEFHTASRGGGGSDLTSPRRFSTGALPAPITTPPCQEDAPAIQSMMMVQPWTLTQRQPTGHSFERRRGPQEGQRAHAHA
jgi:hypothetical protein